MPNQGNTTQGTNIEHLFANSIADHPKAWGDAVKLVGDYEDSMIREPSVTGSNHRKGDVNVPYENKPDIRVNIKSFRGPGYNQVERRRVDQFCSRNQIRSADEQFLTDIWLRKAHNNGQGRLVYPEEQDRVREIFSTIEPGVSALVGNDHPQIFALYRFEDSKWHLYDMKNQVLPLIQGQEISFTTLGGNIHIGNYIVIQRKGSRRGETGTDPYSITHGSNHVQIKMKVGKFFNDIEPASFYIV